ncbi:MAG TPA: tetratricopeptide repeat protein [Stellaceae bacterium]|nr:tetratricopeptide repeat protein [Stellaceae bacterium]
MTLRFKFNLRQLFIAVAFWGVLASPAAAEENRAALEAQKDQLFQQMLANPANLDVAFAYADVSARLGDNEAAVSALERMLLFNPNLPRVDLELGALYFRMGSFEVAQTYFDKAAAGNPPPEVQQRINEYQALIAQQQSPTRLTGTLFFGAQYQSDANIAPASGLIASPIGPILLNNQFVKMSDWDIFAGGSLLYSYDLGTQDHDTIEVTGNGLVNHYMKVGRLDLDFGEVTVGPRVHFPQFPDTISQAVTVKPYGIFNEVGLGESQYFRTFGAGLEATGIVWDDIALRGVFEYRDKTFTNAPDRPASTGLTGNDKVVSLAATKPLPFNSSLSLEFDYVDQQTAANFYSNQSYAVSAAYHIRYDAPAFSPFRFPMETTVYGSRLWSIYDAPDPCCVINGGFSSRDDRRWRFGITEGVQVTDNIEAIIQFQRDIVSSNLPLYGYTSNSVVIGPQIRF